MVQAYKTDFDWTRECEYISYATDDVLRGSPVFKARALKNFSVYQRAHDWFVSFQDQELPFSDGMVIHA